MSFGEFFYIKRRLKEDLLEIPCDAMQYVTIEKSLIDALEMKREYTKSSNLEYYIINIGLEGQSHYRIKMQNGIQPHPTNPKCHEIHEHCASPGFESRTL